LAVPADPVPTSGYEVPASVGPARGDRYLAWPATVVTVGLGASIALDLVSVVMVPLGDKAVAWSTDDLIDLIYTAFLIATLVDLFVTFGGFMLWSFRARATVESWGVRGLGWGSKWAIEGWFFPFANLVIPKLVMDAIWSGTIAPLGTTTTPRRSSPLVAGWWWTFVAYLVANLTGGFVPPDLDTAVFAGINAAIAVLGIVSAALAILLVRRITHLQRARQAALDAWVSQNVPGR
jgi:hypothetical protein